MPQLATANFGDLEYTADQVLEFPAALPAFEDQTSFVIVKRSALGPLVFLQSLANPKLCFITLPMGLIDPGYELELIAEDARLLGLDQTADGAVRDPIDLLCLAMLVVTENRPTANLMAPVVINLKNRRGVQAVRVDTRYSYQHPLAEPSCS
jgi:flagellar assembly factor FliW